MQVLEDFLRHQVRSMDDVKRLRQHELDGPGGLFGMPRARRDGGAMPKGSIRMGNFFDLALESIN
jgi:hypothetical protein